MNGKALEERLWRFMPAPVRHPAQVVTRAASLWLSQGGPQYGAAIAFYTMFALAPLLVLAIWLTGMVFGAEAARGQIVVQIENMVGRTAAQGIESLIEAAWREPVGNLAGALAILTLLLGASGVFAQLRLALNAMAEIREVASPVGAFVRGRLVAFALVLGFGLLVMILLMASTVLAAFGAWLSHHLPASGLPALLSLADVTLSTSAIALGIAGLFRWLPDRPASRRAIWIGAVSSALLFSLGKHLIGLYLARASVASSYGAAGSFVVVMMWMYYSAQIVLFGASLSHALEERYLSRLAEDTPPWNPDGHPAPSGSRPLPFIGSNARRDPGLRSERRSLSEQLRHRAALPPRQGAEAAPTTGGGAKVLPFPLAASQRRRQPGA